jgi:NAD(P)-dependent dehydrogenase (short-subunit alcohol dehydrogenase family)
MEFKGKTAVVTGSSGGIGKAVAILLAKEGTDVVLAARNVPKMEAVKEEIEALGRKAVVIKCDVTDDDSVFNMKDKAIKAFGNIDILINNAAVGVRGLLEDMAMDDWKYVIDTNLIGYIRNVTAFLPHFMKRGSGYIVNVASIQALAYGTDMLNTGYITTKAGIIGLTSCLCSTLKLKGIKVSCLIPGGVSTEIGRNTRYVGTEAQKKELLRQYEEFQKMPMFLKPEQCAQGLIDGMKKEAFFILTPPTMAQMLKGQGVDVDMINAFMANPPPPRMPGPQPK